MIRDAPEAVKKYLIRVRRRRVNIQIFIFSVARIHITKKFVVVGYDENDGVTACMCRDIEN